MSFAADLRAASVTLLRGYRDSLPDGRLNVDEGRPVAITPPHAFFDRVRERFDPIGSGLLQRTPQALILVCHGLWDGKDTAAQRDAFVDGFLEYTRTRVHEAGANTLLELRAVEDIPFFVPEWLDASRQRAYHATQLTLEGYAET